jgi:hypothetical protein
MVSLRGFPYWQGLRVSYRPRGERGCVMAAIILVLLPVLYVLSAGPIVAIWNHGVITGGWANGFIFWFYTPLRLASKCYPPYGDWAER